MKLVTQEQVERILLIQQTLLDGMPAKDITKVLKELTQGLYILHITKGMEGLKRKPIEKNNGLLRFLTEYKQDLQNTRNNIGDAQKS